MSKRDDAQAAFRAAAARRREELRRKSREWRDPEDPDWWAHHDEEGDYE